MNRLFAYSWGSALVLATGAYLLLRSKSKIRFQQLNVLDKTSLIHLFKEIRKKYSEKFSLILRLNRKKRRVLHRGGREYRMLIKELKDQAKEYIQNSVEEVLAFNGLNEEILSASFKHFENDNDIRSALSKICSVETHKISSLLNRKLQEILEIYIARIEELNETDPNELNVQMKIIEDEIYDEFGCEPEEIEAAVNKNFPAVENLVKIIKELNDVLLDKTNQELFF